MSLAIKQCPQCKSEGIGPIPISGFAKNKSSRSGYQSWCKTHHRKLSSKWYYRNTSARKKYCHEYVRTTKGWAIYALKRAGREERAGVNGVTISVSELQMLVEEALDKGIVTLDTNKPDTASIDQIVSGQGYSIENTQVVPRWYNMAKLHFTEEQLIEAVHKFGWKTY